jgi:hypothetical protein
VKTRDFEDTRLRTWRVTAEIHAVEVEPERRVAVRVHVFADLAAFGILKRVAAGADASEKHGDVGRGDRAVGFNGSRGVDEAAGEREVMVRTEVERWLLGNVVCA